MWKVNLCLDTKNKKEIREICKAYGISVKYGRSALIRRLIEAAHKTISKNK